MDSWQAMESVDKLEQFILSEVNRLKLKPCNMRTKRQIRDGKTFVKMLHTMPYCGARRVGELVKLISKKREELKAITKDLSRLLPNHQISIFEDEQEVSKERSELLEIQKKILEEEIHWLHKALGICRNKAYFK